VAQVIQFAILGLGIGAVLTLLAQGIVLVYRASGILNFAHGAMGMVGAYIWVELNQNRDWPFLVALLIAMAVTAALGAVVYLVVMRPLRKKSPLTQVIATLGLLIALQAAATIRYADAITTVNPSPLPHRLFHVGDVVFSEDRIWILGTALTITLLLYAGSKFTHFGLATAAAAENPRAVAGAGWSPDVLSAVNWALGGALAALAGVLITPLIGLQVTTLTFLVIAALAAALVGGFSSFPLTLLGALAIGIIQSEMAKYVSTPGLSDAVPFVAIVLILVVSGRALPLRTYLIERLPELGKGRLRPIPIAISLAVLMVLTFTVMGNKWLDATSVSFSVATMLLSVVVLTGYTGQLSLAQFALGGMGALIAGRLVAAQGWPFEFALLAGVLGTIPVGLVFAVPALRTRGINLAVVTLGLGLAVQQVVFLNSNYTGGPEGTTVNGQTLFGVDIDPIIHPDRYVAFSVGCFLVAALAVRNIRSSRAGRRLIAVRTNERAAASLGVSVLGAKLYAFAVSAAIAGLAGIVLAFRSYSIIYENFNPLSSIQAVTLAVVGGVGYVIGPLFGSTLAAGGVGTEIGSLLFGSGHDQWLVLFGGVLLILLVLQDPNGMASHSVHNVNAIAGKLRSLRRAKPQPGPKPLPDVKRERVAPATLEVADVKVQFGGVVALERAGLTVKTGEIVGLIGPNGAGKTTLIDAVTGFVRPVAGSVRLNGKAIDKWPPHRRARAAMTRSFQSLELFNDVSVGDNLRAASDRRDSLAYLTNIVWPAEQPLSATAVAAIREFGLEEDLDKRPDALPYGRRRLVAIARAVATEPSILLLDEPAAGLDEPETAELGRLVRRLTDEWGLGVLLIEHDMSIVMGICDRIVVLDFGRVIATGTPEEIRRNPEVIAAYLGEAEEPDDSKVTDDESSLAGVSVAVEDRA
jgi:sulfate-transporting ATPase